MAASADFSQQLAAKVAQRAADEAIKPLAARSMACRFSTPTRRRTRLLFIVFDKQQRKGQKPAGCGYQAAVLAELTTEVYAVERLAPLLEKAKTNMRILQQFNVRLKYADGHLGLPDAGPFDSIVVVAAGSKIPPALLTQLAPGGRMVLPVGVQEQYLCLIERTPQGFTETRLDPVRFVPLLPGTQ